jgi:hypothetical protein
MSVFAALFAPPRRGGLRAEMASCLAGLDFPDHLLSSGIELRVRELKSRAAPRLMCIGVQRAWN